MANELFQCEVLTPDGRVFSGQVREVTLPAHDGQMGVLVNHAPMVCELGYGLLQLWTGEGTQERRYIEGGFVQIVPDRTVILTRSALRTEEVTRESALRLLEEAKGIQGTDEVSARLRGEIEANAQARLRIAGGAV